MSADESVLLDARRVRVLLTELGARLLARGVEGRLFLVGGAAMALSLSRRRVTRDLDAVFEPKQVIYEEAAVIARAHGLPTGWLNASVKSLFPDLRPPIEGTSSFSAPGLHVGVAPPAYLFAMKAQAARTERDGEDLRFLAGLLRIERVDQALDLVQSFYGPGRLSVKTQLLLGEILGAPDSGPVGIGG